MIELIGLSVLIGLFCNGLYIATSEGMILHFVRVWLNSKFIYSDTQRKMVQYYSKSTSYYDFNYAENHVKTEVAEIKVSKVYYPILYCIRCMPSLYGTVIVLLVLPLSPALLWQLPIIIVSSIATSTIIYNLYE